MTQNILRYIKTFLKWILLSLIVGAAGGIVGSLFHKSIDYVTELRTANTWIIFLLPFGGLAIAGIYSAFKSKGKIDTNRVIDPVIGAAVGFVALFCSVVNCPVASLLLAIEVFGGQGILLFGITCAVSYMMSGNFGLYKSQKIVYSKLNANYMEIGE